MGSRYYTRLYKSQARDRIIDYLETQIPPKSLRQAVRDLLANPTSDVKLLNPSPYTVHDWWQRRPRIPPPSKPLDEIAEGFWDSDRPLYEAICEHIHAHGFDSWNLLPIHIKERIHDQHTLGDNHDYT